MERLVLSTLLQSGFPIPVTLDRPAQQAGNYLYIPEHEAGESTTRFLVYDLASGDIAASASTAGARYLEVMSDGRYIYAAQDWGSADATRYDPASDVWDAVVPDPSFGRPQYRWGAATGVGRLWVPVRSPAGPQELWTWDATAQTWSLVDTPAGVVLEDIRLLGTRMTGSTCLPPQASTTRGTCPNRWSAGLPEREAGAIPTCRFASPAGGRRRCRASRRLRCDGTPGRELAAYGVEIEFTTKSSRHWRTSRARPSKHSAEAGWSKGLRHLADAPPSAAAAGWVFDAGPKVSGSRFVPRRKASWALALWTLFWALWVFVLVIATIVLVAQSAGSLFLRFMRLRAAALDGRARPDGWFVGFIILAVVWALSRTSGARSGDAATASHPNGTVTVPACPRCGHPREIVIRYCTNCEFDYQTAPELDERPGRGGDGHC